MTQENDAKELVRDYMEKYKCVKAFEQLMYEFDPVFYALGSVCAAVIKSGYQQSGKA